MKTRVVVTGLGVVTPIDVYKRQAQGLKVALITDAGTPGISDPGEELVLSLIHI